MQLLDGNGQPLLHHPGTKPTIVVDYHAQYDPTDDLTGESQPQVGGYWDLWEAIDFVHPAYGYIISTPSDDNGTIFVRVGMGDPNGGTGKVWPNLNQTYVSLQVTLPYKGIGSQPTYIKCQFLDDWPGNSCILIDQSSTRTGTWQQSYGRVDSRPGFVRWNPYEQQNSPVQEQASSPPPEDDNQSCPLPAIDKMLQMNDTGIQMQSQGIPDNITLQSCTWEDLYDNGSTVPATELFMLPVNFDPAGLDNITGWVDPAYLDNESIMAARPYQVNMELKGPAGMQNIPSSYPAWLRSLYGDNISKMQVMVYVDEVIHNPSDTTVRCHTQPIVVIDSRSCWTMGYLGEGTSQRAVITLYYGDPMGTLDLEPWTPANLGDLISAMDAKSGDANWNANADLDGDGEVTSTDMAIALANYQSRGTINGAVALADYGPGSQGVQVTVDLTPSDQSAPPVSSTATLDSNGTLTLPYDVGPGTYDVGIKALTCQRAVVANVSLPGGPVTLDNVTLANGDCNGDNVISTADLAIVLNAMGTTLGNEGWDARADLNGDNQTTTADLAIVLSAMQAAESNSQAIVRVTPSVSSIYPGDNFTVTVEVVTTDKTVTALDYFVQVMGEGSSCFTLVDRNTDNTSFPYLIFPNVIVLYPTYAALSPCNGKDLAGLVDDLNYPAGPGTMLVSTLTIQSDPSTPAGTYTFVPAGVSVCGDNCTSLDNATVEAATVEVLDSGQGQNRISQNLAGESQTQIPSLDDVIEDWLRAKLGNDYDTFDLNNPPSYLSRQDADFAAFLWYWLQSGQ